MTNVFLASVHEVAKVEAKFEEFGGSIWIDLVFTDSSDAKVSITLFFDDREIAKAYVNAINNVATAL